MKTVGRNDKGCPKNSKAGPEVMEAAVVTIEGSLDQMEATDFWANPEGEETATWTISGHCRADKMLKTWYCGTIDELRSGPKETVESRRRWRLPRTDWYASLSLQSSRDTAVRVQTGTGL
jgi:hypothetical protein